MKKLSFFVVFLSLVLFILPGCEKDPVIPQEKPVNIDLSATNLNPDYMGNVTFTWNVTGDYKSIAVSLNNEVISTSKKGNHTISSITTKQTISVACWVEGSSEPIVRSREISPKDQPVFPAKSITVVADPAIIPYGGGIITISWTTKNTKFVYFNSNLYEPTYSTQIWLNKATTLFFTLKGEGPDTDIIDSLRLEIESPPPVPLIVGSWKMINFFYTCPAKGIFHEELEIAECDEDNLWIFRLDNKMELNLGSVLCPGEIYSSFVFDYTLTGDSLYGLGNVRHIELLTVDSLIWTFEDIWILVDGTIVPNYLEQVFVRQ